ncbi:MAG: hypothetical protein KAJ23_18935, partial [Maribacter sp.]|nr:hypothetical protein [Maribacter sp.]
SNALELYERAIAIDPNFVESYLGAAYTWMSSGLVWGLHEEQEAWGNAKYFIREALKIDPISKEINDELYIGYFYYDWDFEKVEPYYQERLRNPISDIAPAISTDYAIKTGRYEDAIRAMDENILIAPSVGIFYFFKAEALMCLGRINEAVKILNTADPLYSDNWFYLRESAKIYFYLKEYEKSRNQLNKLLTRFPDYPPILMWLSAVYAQMDGNVEAVNEYLSELHSKYDEGSSGSPAWFLAMYYCVLEDYEQAFYWLQQSYERHEVEMTWLKEEPLLIPLRNDQRYLDLYEKVGFLHIGLPRTTTSVN